jgi:hypothetical protein
MSGSGSGFSDGRSEKLLKKELNTNSSDFFPFLGFVCNLAISHGYFYRESLYVLSGTATVTNPIPVVINRPKFYFTPITEGSILSKTLLSNYLNGSYREVKRSDEATYRGETFQCLIFALTV